MNGRIRQAYYWLLPKLQWSISREMGGAFPFGTNPAIRERPVLERLPIPRVALSARCVLGIVRAAVRARLKGASRSRSFINAIAKEATHGSPSPRR